MTWKGPVIIGILGGPLQDVATLAARTIAARGSNCRMAVRGITTVCSDPRIHTAGVAGTGIDRNAG